MFTVILHDLLRVVTDNYEQLTGILRGFTDCYENITKSYDSSKLLRGRYDLFTCYYD